MTIFHLLTWTFRCILIRPPKASLDGWKSTCNLSPKCLRHRRDILRAERVRPPIDSEATRLERNSLFPRSYVSRREKNLRTIRGAFISSARSSASCSRAFGDQFDCRRRKIDEDCTHCCRRSRSALTSLKSGQHADSTPQAQSRKGPSAFTYPSWVPVASCWVDPRESHRKLSRGSRKPASLPYRILVW